DLHLDVTRLVHEFLEIELAVAERLQGLGLAGGVGARQAVAVAHQPHAAPPAPRDGLEDHGVADLAAQAWGFLDGPERPPAAGNHRGARLLGDSPRLRLVAHEPDRLG